MSAAALPLHVAVLGNNRTRITQLLAQSECNVSALDNEGMSPLHYAAAYDEAAILAELLGHSSSNVDVRNRRDNTPLHTAAAHDASAAVGALLQGGADVNAVNQWNETPLIVACCGGHVRTVRALLAHGADCAPLDRWQSSALDVAVAHQAVDVVSLLRYWIEHGALPVVEPVAATAAVSAAVVPRLRSFVLAKLIEAPLANERFLHLLQNAELGVNAPDYFGMTALHKLVAWNKSELIAPFLAHRRVDVPLLCVALAGKSRDSVLHLAVQMGALEAARELLERAPAATRSRMLALRNEAQQSALELATQSGQAEFVTLFTSLSI